MPPQYEQGSVSIVQNASRSVPGGECAPSWGFFCTREVGSNCRVHCAAHVPITAVHCPAVRQTSEPRQSASVAAMQVSPSSEHLPANEHCWDFLHSLSNVAMHPPSLRWHAPVVTQGPLNAHSG